MTRILMSAVAVLLLVSPGDVVRVLDPASGSISFFNGFGGLGYGPEGNGTPVVGIAKRSSDRAAQGVKNRRGQTTRTYSNPKFLKAKMGFE